MPRPAKLFLILLSLTATVVMAGRHASAQAPPTAPLTIEQQPATKTGYALEVLNSDRVNGGALPRRAWRVDIDLAVEGRATDDDYRNNPLGLVRFHHAPLADFSGDPLWSLATFNFRNCSPGNARLNSGDWARLEQHIRDAITPTTTAYVFTAPLWLPDSRGTVTYRVIGVHGLPVPTHYGKAVLFDHGGGQLEAEAWLAENKAPAAGTRFDDWRTSVDRLEGYSGRNLFAWVDDETETRLESGE